MPEHFSKPPKDLDEAFARAGIGRKKSIRQAVASMIPALRSGFGPQQIIDKLNGQANAIQVYESLASCQEVPADRRLALRRAAMRGIEEVP